MYAISFDLSVQSLQKHYTGNNHTNAYGDIKRFLESKGFSNQQGSVYFGNESTNAVNTVMAVNALSLEFTWLKLCVTDIRMLRVEENNNLEEAL
jgi:virulence-associated protein VapD